MKIDIPERRMTIDILRRYKELVIKPEFRLADQSVAPSLMVELFGDRSKTELEQEIELVLPYSVTSPPNIDFIAMRRWAHTAFERPWYLRTHVYQFDWVSMPFDDIRTMHCESEDDAMLFKIKWVDDH